jgi:hypothetical protein
MSAISCWPHWTVRRTVALLLAGDVNIDPEYLAEQLECDLDDAHSAIGAAASMCPPGICLYSKAGAH